MKLRKRIHTILSLVRKNYILSLFVLIVVLVGLVSVFKLATSENEYVYARIKVSQGLWWAATQRPNLWYVRGITKGLKDTVDDTPNAEIISVRYYPFWNSDTYDVFVIAKLAVTKNKKTDEYIYDREPLTIASPIELFFPSVQVSGTVLEFSEEPIIDTTVEKTVTIIKHLAYPSEYQSITIGDSYFDGEEKVFEVLSKKSENLNAFSIDTTERSVGPSEKRMNVEVQAKIRVYEAGANYLFGQEHIVKLGKNLNISTPSFIFEEFEVAKIE